MPEKKANSKPSERKASSRILREYFCDCSKQDMIYGSLIRSPVSSGKITNITIKDFPEGYFLYTARDIPGINHLDFFDAKDRIFCNETVHYLGEPAGIVVGPDLETVRKLSKEVQITFDITTIDSALHEIAEEYNKPLIDFPKRNAQENEINAIAQKLTILPSLDSLPKTNSVTSYTKPEQISRILSPKNKLKKSRTILAQTLIQKGAFDKKLTKPQLNGIFKASFKEFSSSWTFKDVSTTYFENLGALAKFDNGKLTVICPSQWQKHLQSNLSSILSIPKEKIDIKTSKLHDLNQNGLFHCTTLAAAASIASMHSGFPVKVELSDEEQLLYYNNSPETKLTYRTGINEDGLIESMMIQIETDGGASNPFAKEIADRLAIAACSMYSGPNLSIESTVYASSSAPTTMDPSKIDSAAFFGIENHLNYISKETGILPYELRLKNMDRKDAVFKFQIDKKADLINKMVSDSLFARKFASCRLNINNENISDSSPINYIPRRGIGMASAYQGTYFLGSSLQSDIFMELTLNLDGGVTITAPVTNALVVESWKKTVSEALSIETQDVKVELLVDDQEKSYPAPLLKFSGILTTLLKKCIQDIQKKRFYSPLPITSRKTPSPALKKSWNKELFSGTPFFSPSFVTVSVEVQIDPLTLTYELKKLFVFFNCGEIISPMAINSSMQLAVQKELSKLNIFMPLDSEHFRLRFAPSTQPSGQIGSLIHNALPAALTSALSLALSKDITTFPVDQNKIFEILKPAEKNPETEEHKEDSK